ncbi:MAG: glycosyltransferase family 4 protein [Candidatus Promineifilaceae bacterium]
MLIGIDCRLPTYRMGGISQYILHLLPALAAIDDKNQFIVYQSRREERDFVPEDAARWRRRNLWTPCHHRLERYTLAAEMARDGLAVLHSPDFIPPATGHTRRVITIHDLNFLHFPELLTDESRRYYAGQIKWAVATADAIAADSYATRRDVMELLGVAPEKVKAIHLAANPLYTQAPEPAQVARTLKHLGLPEGFLLSVGTLEPRKNLPMLVRIYARLRREHGIKVPLVLVGRKGWLYEEIFAAIEQYGLSQNVVHIEGATDEVLRNLYHAASALLTPSLYEGFGLPALEAQHSGCAAIVSDRGSLPEIVGSDGLILPLEDEDAWVNTTWLVLMDKEFAAQAVEVGYTQCRQFSWTKTAQSTLALYTGRQPVSPPSSPL